MRSACARPALTYSTVSSQDHAANSEPNRPFGLYNKAGFIAFLLAFQEICFDSRSLSGASSGRLERYCLRGTSTAPSDVVRTTS
jgi:hypothetical protein